MARQPQLEFGTGRAAAVHLDPATMALNHCLHQRQAQPYAADIRVAALVQALEGLE